MLVQWVKPSPELQDAAPPPIHLPASGLGKHWKTGQVLEPLPLTGEMWMKLLTPGFSQA